MARTENLVFTGIWERAHDRAIARERAKQIREKYKCRAVMVNEDGGVAVYADKKYEDLKQAERLEARLNSIPNTRQRLLEQLAELDEEETRLIGKIAELRARHIAE